MLRHLVAFGLCAGLVFGQACAQTIFSDDFQDGEADGWAGDPARGSVQLTEYAGNISMRLTRNASAVAQVNLAGVKQVQVSASFAAMELEGEDACLLEFSDDGQNWIEIGRVADGQDDGLTLHRVSKNIDIRNGAEFGYIGVRIKANADNDTCWVDNIAVAKVMRRAELQQSISAQAFAAGAAADKPYASTAFAPAAAAGPPPTALQGVLRFEGEEADNFILRKDDFNYAPEGESLRVLPPIKIHFAQAGNEIVPVQRGPRAGAHPDWEWIVEPGRAWRDDQGFIRASFPFSLQERNANCIHNGLAAFRMSDSGALSHLVYQIGSETCTYMQFDMWGAGAASFERRSHPDADSVIAAYKQEKSARLDTRTIQELRGFNSGGFGSPEEVTPSAMTAFGYATDDTHYVGGCDTRFGPYPYCDVLDLPSYSWAKSIVAGVAAMRLEKIYPGAMASLISDYVPACAGSIWDGVTFHHALNMTTGVFNSDVYDEDEQSPPMRRFFLAETNSEKLDIACTAFTKNAEPGETFVYRTVDTYILGAAMNAFLREKTGEANADFYRDLLAPIWTQLGLSPVVMNTRRSLDAAVQPFTGWGLTLHSNDIVLIAKFLMDGGVIAGQELLDAAMLRQSLQKDPSNRGLAAVIPSQRYRNGFWAWNAGEAIGCAKDVWIPVMSGHGGLSAALLPNDHVYYYVSDGGEFAWRKAAQASNELKPFCEARNDNM
ncbi:hypothetical protein [Hyphococcus sp.]|uniref:hypothetical protein n=1 Tax=Hyphococcus sp. TaxID=2038636 RepID=UPI003CCC3AF4